MKIAIKANHIMEGGGLTHFNHITEWFAKLAPESEFIVLGKEGQQSLFCTRAANFRYQFYDLPARSLFHRIYWEWRILPRIVRELQPDILFEAGNYGAGAVGCPRVSLIHNIAPFGREYISGESLRQRIRLTLLRWATVRSLRTSDGVVFLSEFCRTFLAPYINSNTRSVVAHHGKPERFSYDNDSQVLESLNIHPPYLLSVSHVYRYKNIREMIEGYIAARESNPEIPPLYIAGKIYDRGYYTAIKDLLSSSEHGARVVFLGNVDNQRLQVLYRHSKYFLFPSTLETCSVILIEALANGCIILSSDRMVMPEIASGAALYFDPDDTDEIARRILQVSQSESLRKHLREQALKQAQQFSWQESAERILDLFDLLLNRKAGVDAESVTSQRQ